MADGKCPYSNEEPLRTIPGKNMFGLFNIIRTLIKGNPEFDENILKYDSRVFKTMYDRETIIVTDHKSVDLIFDYDKVEKLEDGFGYVRVVKELMLNHVPIPFSVGIDHENKKSAMLQFMAHINQNLRYDDLAKLVEDQFLEFKNFENLSFAEAEKKDIEGMLKKASLSVTTEILCGTPVDYEKLERCLMRTFYITYLPRPSTKKTGEMSAELYEEVLSTPVGKKILEIVKTNELTDDEVLFQYYWMICFNGCSGVEATMISMLICYVRLSVSEKKLLSDEIAVFFASDKKSIEKLIKLNVLHSFYVETLRLNPPAPAAFRILKEDTVLNSTSGRYQLKKGDLVCARLPNIHRDANIFDDPCYFKLDRDVKLTEENMYSFSGKLNAPSLPGNRKCAGQRVAEVIIKLFVANFTRCTIEPSKYPCHTGKNLLRPLASDEELKLKTFIYNPNY